MYLRAYTSTGPKRTVILNHSAGTSSACRRIWETRHQSRRDEARKQRNNPLRKQHLDVSVCVNAHPAILALANRNGIMVNLKSRQRQEYEVLHSLTHMAELKDPCEEAKPLRLGRRLAESIPECWGFVVVEIRGLAFPGESWMSRSEKLE
jgi:hypothetical protein